MTMAHEQKRYTYQDYASWDDDERWELIDGLPYNMSPAPRIKHQQIAGNFHTFLNVKLDDSKCQALLSPIDVVLSDYDVVQPDVIAVCDETKITELNIQGAPDLVLEVLSPSTSHKDRWLKRNLYEKYGVKEFLLADVDGEYIERYTLQENGIYGKSEIFGKDETLKLFSLPELEIPLDKIFK